jgi:mRNA-degrading endonuclease toxin of MazEF toxin-antitoxin module
MPVLRGTVYRFAGGSSDLYGALVLTNDVWNRRMATVGVVPVRAPSSPTSVWEPLFSREPELQARVGFLAAQPRGRLLEARFVLAADQLARVAVALSDLLSVPDLAASPPEAPSSVPGPADYPRWAEIYYAGPPVAGQVKRYVVVSRDHWNATSASAVAVRTTSQPKAWGTAFPAIQGGAARACCGDATALPRGRFDLARRPSPLSLDLEDMARIARGLADVFELDASPSSPTVAPPTSPRTCPRSGRCAAPPARSPQAG